MCENGGKCHHVNGLCDCLAGFFGKTCEKECPENAYGSNCSKSCDCVNSKSCNARNGNCVCRTGWTDTRCASPCPHEHFGDNCRSKCQCENLLLQHCHIEMGCVCTFGAKGNVSGIIQSNVPLDECVDPFPGSPFPRYPVYYSSGVQQQVSAISEHNSEEGIPPSIQKLIFVLIIALVIGAVGLVLYYKRLDSTAETAEHSFANAIYYNASSQAVSLQPSQQYLQSELPHYNSIITDSSPGMIESEKRPESEPASLTTHIYDVPRFPTTPIQTSPNNSEN